jgi:hypothetical protein
MSLFGPVRLKVIRVVMGQRQRAGYSEYYEVNSLCNGGGIG